MPIPELATNGLLPPGIYAASVREATARFGTGSPARQRQAVLLESVVAAGLEYPSVKRVLVWGSFVSNKAEPADLDYSVVVSVDHDVSRTAQEHRAFLDPVTARMRYGADRGYLLIPDYPIEGDADRLYFLCHNPGGIARGIVEISLRGELAGERA